MDDADSLIIFYLSFNISLNFINLFAFQLTWAMSRFLPPNVAFDILDTEGRKKPQTACPADWKHTNRDFNSFFASSKLQFYCSLMFTHDFAA